MANRLADDQKRAAEAFSRQAQTRQPGIIGETIGWLRSNKKWWFLPVLVALLLAGAIVFLGSSPLAPFIYTLF